MARVEYIPEDGIGKVIQIDGFKNSPEPLEKMFGRPIQTTLQATYYHQIKEEGKSVLEISISESNVIGSNVAG